jgi:hypothetical protein
MLDEIIVLETPPLYNCYSRIGEQKCVPIFGGHARRVVHGALNIQSGDLMLLITPEWNQWTHQDFVGMVRAHWRGWHIVLFEDRGSPHTATASQAYAAERQIEIRWLPRATPELNAMEQLWRQATSQALANGSPLPIETKAMKLCQCLIDLQPKERLRKAGVLAPDFWLAP